jgi:hypothetical protein
MGFCTAWTSKSLTLDPENVITPKDHKSARITIDDFPTNKISRLVGNNKDAQYK